jgi:uncharacterized protein (TIGR02118 family)
MVKIIICAVRKAGMSFQEFDTYWRDQHATVIKSVPEFNRHVRRYVQCHLISTDVPFATTGAYDGVAELWFDDVASLNKAFAEPRYLEVIRQDELKFADVERCMSFVTQEFEVI